MEINIKKTDENPYLQRKEVHGTVTFTGATPAQKQLADALATKLNVKADAIFVNHVFTSFGSQAAAFEAHLYPSKEQLDKVVRLGKKAKEKLAKATAAPAAVAADQPAKPALPAAAQAEAPKAEAKAEPKKEEVKPAEAKSEPKKEEPKKAEAKVEHKKEAPAGAKKEEPKKEEPKKAEA